MKRKFVLIPLFTTSFIFCLFGRGDFRKRHPDGPIVDNGVFVITHINSCRRGVGYCVMGNDCQVDKDFVADDLGGHCQGLIHAFYPPKTFVCCRENPSNFLDESKEIRPVYEHVKYTTSRTTFFVQTVTTSDSYINDQIKKQTTTQPSQKVVSTEKTNVSSNLILNDSDEFNSKPKMNCFFTLASGIKCKIVGEQKNSSARLKQEKLNSNVNQKIKNVSVIHKFDDGHHQILNFTMSQLNHLNNKTNMEGKWSDIKISPKNNLNWTNSITTFLSSGSSIISVVKNNKYKTALLQNQAAVNLKTQSFVKNHQVKQCGVPGAQETNQPSSKLAKLFNLMNDKKSHQNSNMAELIDEESSVLEVTTSSLIHCWMAAIVSKFQDKNIKLYCTGVLIDTQFVVTTATCIQRIQQQGGLDKYSVVLGSSKLDKNLLHSAQIRKIQQTVMHPDFNQDVGSHDIGLIRLNSDVQITSTTCLVCLSKLGGPDFSALSSRNCSVTGFSYENGILDKDTEMYERKGLLQTTSMKCNFQSEAQFIECKHESEPLCYYGPCKSTKNSSRPRSNDSHEKCHGVALSMGSSLTCQNKLGLHVLYSLGSSNQLCLQQGKGPFSVTNFHHMKYASSWLLKTISRFL